MAPTHEEDLLSTGLANARKAAQRPLRRIHGEVQNRPQVPAELLHGDLSTAAKLLHRVGWQNALAGRRSQALGWRPEDVLGRRADVLAKLLHGLCAALVVGQIGDILAEYELKRVPGSWRSSSTMLSRQPFNNVGKLGRSSLHNLE